MKRFLFHISVYVLLLSVLINLIIQNYIHRHWMPFFTNSISYNAKATFILEHEEAINKSNIYVLGSSMSLNNIDCKYLSEVWNQPVYNLSSWSMKLQDFKDFPVWKKDATIITNINFMDFKKSTFKKKVGYPYSNKPWQSYLNILLDFQTYRDHIRKMDFQKSHPQSDFYDALHFDETGSMIFTNKNVFKIDSIRWNSAFDPFTEKEMDAFVNQVKLVAPKINKMIIFFSPVRPSQYSESSSQLVKRLHSNILKIPNVIFVNKFDDKNFNDDDFVDNSHFSREGAKKYTLLMAKEIGSDTSLIQKVISE